MQFSTLFLIASAVLAMPTDQRSPVQLAKKDALAADAGFAFPTEDMDDPWSTNYRFKNSQNRHGLSREIFEPTKAAEPAEPAKPAQPAQKGKKKGTRRNPFRGARDNKGRRCIKYNGKAVRDIPVECIKPLFCNKNYIVNDFECESCKMDTWTIEDLEEIGEGCIRESICKPDELYSSKLRKQ